MRVRGELLHKLVSRGNRIRSRRLKKCNCSFPYVLGPPLRWYDDFGLLHLTARPMYRWWPFSLIFRLCYRRHFFLMVSMYSTAGTPSCCRYHPLFRRPGGCIPICATCCPPAKLMTERYDTTASRWGYHQTHSCFGENDALSYFLFPRFIITLHSGIARGSRTPDRILGKSPTLLSDRGTTVVERSNLEDFLLTRADHYRHGPGRSSCCSLH